MFRKFLSISMAAMLMSFFCGFNTISHAAYLSADTPVLIQSDSLVSEANYKSGDTVKFHVVNSITDKSGNVIIAAGTPVEASITRLEPKKRIGRHTELSISGFSAVVKGKTVMFNGNIDRKSESRMTRSIVLSAVLLPFFLLMKGAAVELPEGSQHTVYPSTNYNL